MTRLWVNTIGYLAVGLFLISGISLGILAFLMGGWWLLTLLLAFGFLWLAAEVFDAVYDEPDDR